MKNYLIVFLLSALTAITCQAQQYFVKLKGDTVYGKAHLNPILDNSRSIRFVTASGEKLQLKPHLTKAVFYSDEHLFKPVIYHNQRLFMILMEGGSLSAYRYISKNGTSTQVSRVLSKNGKSIEVNKFNFKNQMGDFLGDCPEVVTGLEEKKYRIRNLAEMVRAYNSCSTSESAVAENKNRQASDPKPSTQMSKSVTEAPVIEPSSPELETTSDESDLEEVVSPEQEIEVNHIDSFRTHVAGVEGLSNKTDILELIKDLENRWQQEGVIPDYLWGALENLTKSDGDLTEKVIELKSNLSK
ncbi:MAG: hypothetical protein ACR2MX_03955 [Cyclobacteriaceae bacterium]